MFNKKGVVTQSGADTFTQAVIDTNIQVDGKSGWSIAGLRAYWPLGYSSAVADQHASIIVSTQPTTVTTFDQDEEIVRLDWAVSNTGGVAVAYPLELIQDVLLFEPRLTVQPSLYVGISSAGTGLTNVMYYELFYTVEKLTDLELLRLLQGGV